MRNKNIGLAQCLTIKNLRNIKTSRLLNGESIFISQKFLMTYKGQNNVRKTTSGEIKDMD